MPRTALAGVAQEDVVGLEVAVDHPCPVGRDERDEDLARYTESTYSVPIFDFVFAPMAFCTRSMKRGSNTFRRALSE